LKKLYLVACLSFVLAPHTLLAVPQNTAHGNKGHHHHGGAPEMPGIGFGLAAAIGIAGYLVLRRRHTSQT
jgi:MYXO-CTERM domain-containing protein